MNNTDEQHNHGNNITERATGRRRRRAPARDDGSAGYRLVLPYDRPPLTANQRHHWRRRAVVVAEVRRTAATLARSAGVPVLGRCAVRLVWTVTDRRRRDVDNLVPTLKACADGLVDAAVVADDVPALMDKRMPEIVLGERAMLVLIVEPLGGAA